MEGGPGLGRTELPTTRTKWRIGDSVGCYHAYTGAPLFQFGQFPGHACSPKDETPDHPMAMAFVQLSNKLLMLPDGCGTEHVVSRCVLLVNIARCKLHCNSDWNSREACARWTGSRLPNTVRGCWVWLMSKHPSARSTPAMVATSGQSCLTPPALVDLLDTSCRSSGAKIAFCVPLAIELNVYQDRLKTNMRKTDKRKCFVQVDPSARSGGSDT